MGHVSASDAALRLLSHTIGVTSPEDELHKIIHAFDMFGFPTLKDYPVDADAVIEYAKNDKKMVGDKIEPYPSHYWRCIYQYQCRS